jgi:peptidoglycan/LPS O-acetylase OafA/YrhL
MNQLRDGERWRELDAIRGIAACIVVLWHFYQALSPEAFPVWIRWGMERTPLYLIISGTESVMLFFLLSGFVLSLPFHRNPNRLGYRSFLVKRIARIYVPYLGALFLAVLGNACYHGLALNSWFTETWHEAPKFTTILQHVLFLGNYDYYAFNTAFWSLVYEMRISLIFPFLCTLVIRIGWFRAILLAVGLAFSSVILRFAGISSQTTDTFKYISFFVVGILLAQFAVPIRELLSRTPKILRFAGILLSLLFYALAHLLPGAVKDTLILIGASGFIVAGLSEPAFSKALNWPIFQFLGRISYSIYLLHGTILFLLVYAFYGRVPLEWLFLPLLICVVVASTIFYHLVEKPSIQLGRRLAKSVGSRKDQSGVGPVTVASVEKPAASDNRPAGMDSGRVAGAAHEG